jgi:hypothetical protein
MLDDLSVVVQAEDVHARPVGVACPLLITVQNHIVCFSDNTLELDMLAGVFTRHALEVFDEGLLPVSNRRVVLDVHIANMALDRLGWLALIEHQIAKLGYCLLVLL